MFHVDYGCFYLIRDGEEIRVFPPEEIVGSIEVQGKSHIPKVILHGHRVYQAG